MANRQKVDRDTERLLDWLQSRARENEGIIPAFTNEDALAAIGKGSPKKFARAHGNVQSRIDFACFLCGLPPLGLSADSPFSKAWESSDPGWKYPIQQMQAAAQTKCWTDADFDHVRIAVKELSGQAGAVWNNAIQTQYEQVKFWADSFTNITAMPRIPAKLPKENNKRIDWTRDELILALDLYLKRDGKLFDPGDSEIIELSDFLKNFGKTLGYEVSGSFRNPNGVAMKMMNFRRFDPRFKDAGKSGLSRGSSLEGPVWDEYANDPGRLAQVVNAIRKTVEDYSGQTDLTGNDEFGIEEASEGKLLTRLHRFRERNKKLVDKCKSLALKAHGRLFCAACGFDFGKRYGDESSRIIDCHHTKPVHTLCDGQKTKIQDLVLLCANCHRVVHSTKQWLTIEQLKERLVD